MTDNTTERHMEAFRGLLVDSFGKFEFLLNAISKGREADHDILIALQTNQMTMIKELQDHELRIRQLENVEDFNKRINDLETSYKSLNRELHGIHLSKMKYIGFGSGIATAAGIIWKLLGNMIG